MFCINFKYINAVTYFLVTIKKVAVNEIVYHQALAVRHCMYIAIQFLDLIGYGRIALRGIGLQTSCTGCEVLVFRPPALAARCWSSDLQHCLDVLVTDCKNIVTDFFSLF